MVASSAFSTLPSFREEFKSLEHCTDIYMRDDDGYLAEAIQDATSGQGKLSKAAPELFQQAAQECGKALWGAMGEYNEFRRARGVLGGLEVPDYEVLTPTFKPSEDEDKGEYGNDKSVYAGPIELAARLRRSRTQWGKLDVLVKEADAIAKRIEEFAQGFDFAQRMGIINHGLQALNSEEERRIMRSLLVELVARVRGDQSLLEIHNALKKLSEFRDKGGNPGYVFQREFILLLIPFWVSITGSKPKREDLRFLPFVQAAYLVASKEEFIGWENVLVTALKASEKPSH